jgi:fucose 4-O-acetylase-like acetyltransferase
MTSLSELLEPIAAWFRSLGIPEPITHWGHPAMMGIVIFVMGSYVAYAGWRGRLAVDKDVAVKNRADHRKLAPLMFLFLALGYTGGVLSLVMQQKPILESPHFWTGTAAIGLLAINSTLSLSGFWNDKSSLRMLHAYLGTVVFGLLIVHTILGVKLGLSL